MESDLELVAHWIQDVPAVAFTALLGTHWTLGSAAGGYIGCRFSTYSEGLGIADAERRNEAVSARRCSGAPVGEPF